MFSFTLARWVKLIALFFLNAFMHALCVLVRGVQEFRDVTTRYCMHLCARHSNDLSGRLVKRSVEVGTEVALLVLG